MTQPRDPDEPAATRKTPDGSPSEEPAWRRRRRLAAVFGDVLPETTTDERGATGDDGTSESWLRAQVPPHHG